MKKEEKVEENFDDVFDFIVSEDDTVSVSLEVYAVEKNGKRLPKVVDKEAAKETKERLEKDLEELNRKLETAQLSTSDSLEVRRNIEFLTEAIRMTEDILQKPTTTLTATFFMPTWEKDSIIRRESTVEVYNEMKWDETEHVRAVVKYLLKEWNLKQLNPMTKKPEIVPKEAYGRMLGDIVNAFVMKFESKVRNSSYEDEAKN